MIPDFILLESLPLSVPPETAAERPSMLAGLLMAGGVLLAVVIMLRHWRKTARTKTVLDRDPRERIDELHNRSMMGRNRVETMTADAEELVRRLSATLDNKAARLEILIEQAERTIERMGGEPDPTRAEPSAFKMPEPASSSAPDHGDVYRLADQGRSPADIARELDRPVGQVELILNLRA